MFETLDHVAVAILLLGLLIVGVFFQSYRKRTSHASFARVDKQGVSALLGKEFMEPGYWAFSLFAQPFIKLRITPDMVSYASLILAALTGLAAAFGYFGLAALAATLSAAGDSLDGNIATLTGTASDAGEVVDAIVDRYGEFFQLSGLIFYYASNPWLVSIVLLAIIGGYMVTYTTAKAETFQLSIPRGAMRRPERCVYLIVGLAISAIFGPLFNEPHFGFRSYVGIPLVIALLFIGIFGNLSAIQRTRKMISDLKARANN